MATSTITTREQDVLVSFDAKTKLQYLDPESKLFRRYLAPGGAYNTCAFQWKDVIVKDARPTRSDFSLDTSGFCLVEDKSNVSLTWHPLHIPLSKGFCG